MVQVTDRQPAQAKQKDLEAIWWAIITLASTGALVYFLEVVL